MTGTRGSHRLDGFALPFDMVIVLDEHGNRRACRFAGQDSAEDLHGIFFDLHASARTISLLAASQLWLMMGMVMANPQAFHPEWLTMPRRAIRLQSKSVTYLLQ